MIIERREFLRLFGGAAGLAVAGAVGLDQVIDVPESVLDRARNGPGLETWVNTVCGMCPGGCGIRARLIDGIPVSVRGNPNYPVNFGGMCPLGHASLETLFNPDRIQRPMRRIGPPGAGRFEPTDWDVALDEISSRLRSLRVNSRPHRVAFLGAPGGALTEQVVRRFMRSYGSPNVFLWPDRVQETVPYLLTDGRSDLPAFDLLGTRTVLSLGSNFLEEGWSPVHLTRLFSEREEGTRRRLIQVEPRMGLTAAKADRWIPIRPGTYGALALGIAHVLIREELYDAGFVRNHTFGFDDTVDASGERRPGFRSMVLEDYFPERVAGITGVPSETILDVARTLGIDRPSVVVGGSGVSSGVNGTFAQMAVHSLNALLGSIGVEGGIHRAGTAPLTPLPPYDLDATAREGLARDTVGGSGVLPVSGFSLASFTENLLNGSPYPIEVLFLLGGNPVFESISHHDFVEALSRIPVVVSFDPFLSETTEYADLVLPDHTYLEQWDVVTGVPTVGATHVGVRRPAVEPMFDTRQAADVIRDLGRRTDPAVAAAMPMSGQEEAVRHQVRGLYEAGTGAVAAEGVQDAWLEYLRQRGWHMGQYSTFDSFWRELLEHGGWWNPVREDADAMNFPTPSGRFEFYSQALERRVLAEGASPDIPAGTGARLAEMGVGVPGPVAFMPHHEEEQDDDGHPLHLVVFDGLTGRAGSGANLPSMQEQFGMAARRPWRTWCEINPETAGAHGIADGDWIRLESSIGSIRVQAHVTPTVHPEVVAVPFGQGHTSYGRYAEGVGANPHLVVRARYDSISGRAATLSTRVTLSRTA